MADKSQGPDAQGLEMTKFVEGLLTQMRGRFDKMSENIMTKVDEMGHRIDSLERDITALVDQAGGPATSAGGAAAAGASAGGAAPKS
mmetsp:Transcript_32469/g.82490  ORF Transcript_32469/g.82490 Transcript_32469/m.82490 type:complete len:87 (-) Transcript_32469:221-481(-)|eukprot:CAMPEP_0202862220 /NCGR_PEP_ID=MMETSP1391-20130828/3342_1 /ASSEMBLY_ACC=CAM_ASM_000867 /TAXON_ID=1034604 /ORGANISM="Chlamydomonas leiostraca, Strain SAG 11-49" /LENGTH=86 /DNA_ID=CAMNT_0049541725 /DNA_START=108 /DNA_END=368 /DNA_ORIENTATION=-